MSGPREQQQLRMPAISSFFSKSGVPNMIRIPARLTATTLAAVAIMAANASAQSVPFEAVGVDAVYSPFTGETLNTTRIVQRRSVRKCSARG